MRLREKLARYYEEEGAGEALVIEIPVGGYQVRFVPRVIASTLRDAAAKARPSIAVIPLEHLGVRRDDEMLCLGLADQIIDALSRGAGPRVVARHSTMKARAEGMPLAKIAKTFGVAYVLSGSLQRNGDRTRCTVRLCKARDERYLWSERFERTDSDQASLFDFQDAIAAAATAAVGQLDRPDAAKRATVVRFPVITSNVEARELFEQARYLAHKRTFESCEKAIGHLERAILLDPQFARAHGELGLVNFSLAGLRSEAPAENLMAARRAATRALELDPEDGEALGLLAAITFRIDRDWPRAERMFVDALRRSPHASTIHIAFANCLVYNGRYDEALEHARIARAGDPLNLQLRAVAGSVTSYTSREEQAILEEREVLALEPDHLYSLIVLGVSYMATGDLDAAEDVLDRFCALAPHQPGPHFYRIACMGLRGNTDEAIEKLEGLLQRLADRPYSRFALAVAQSATGQIDAMYRSLDYAASVHELLYVTLPVHPLFRRRHGEARFLKQLRDTGLRPAPDATP